MAFVTRVMLRVSLVRLSFCGVKVSGCIWSSSPTTRILLPFWVRFPLSRLGRVDVSLFSSVAVVRSVCVVVRVRVWWGFCPRLLGVVVFDGCMFPRAAVLICYP